MSAAAPTLHIPVIPDSLIHPTALVHARAVIGRNVRIGPFCRVGASVVIEDDCELVGHVTLSGRTTIGARVTVAPFAAIGASPQDLRDAGQETATSIGDDCRIAQGVTINRGTGSGSGLTEIGADCVLAPDCHVAHDCKIGSRVTLECGAMLAGHVTIGDFVSVGPGAGIHQFVRIGRHASIAQQCMVPSDVIPYGRAEGSRASLHGIDVAGLHRRGIPAGDIHDLRIAYRLLFANEGTFAERVEDVSRGFAQKACVTEVIDFVRSSQARAICMP